MTVTISWWAIPVALFVGGFLWAVLDDFGDNSLGAGWVGLAGGFALWVLAAGIVAGRLLA